MADQSNSKTKSISRIGIWANVITQVLIVLLIVMLVNYLGFNHFKRWNIGRSGQVEVSDQTRHLLENLEDKVLCTVLFVNDSAGSGVELGRELRNLLTEYSQISKRKFEIEYVDPFRDLSRARELSAKYKFGRENVLVLDIKGRTKVIEGQEMADYRMQMTPTGEVPELRAFKAEAAITAALIELTQEKAKKVYCLVGHGEPTVKSDSLAAFRQFLERQYVVLEPLDLQKVEAVPEDASAVVLIGLRDDLLERETKILNDYWARKGRVFVALRPEVKTKKLNALLSSWGIEPVDNRLFTSGMAKSDSGDWVEGLVKEVVGNVITGHPTTKRLGRLRLGFPGYTQSLKISASGTSDLRSKPLVQSSEGYWGEVDYDVNLAAGQRIEFNEGKDAAGPLNVIAAAEKGGVEDDRVNLESSRLVVAGNADFLLSDAVQQVRTNLDFTLASMNWLMAREELIGIVPKVKQSFRLDLSEKQVSRLSLLTMVLLPLSVATFGVFVWWRRRA